MTRLQWPSLGSDEVAESLGDGGLRRARWHRLDFHQLQRGRVAVSSCFLSLSLALFILFASSLFLDSLSLFNDFWLLSDI